MINQMNLEGLDLFCKLVGTEFALEIQKVSNPKHKVDLTQKWDRAIHYMKKMAEEFDDLNQWFTAFGGNDDAAEN